MYRFDSKQLPYRIVFKPGGENARQHVLAVANEREELEKPWRWLTGKTLRCRAFIKLGRKYIGGFG